MTASPRTMLAADAEAEFRRTLRRAGVELRALTPRDALAHMTSFFGEVRTADCDDAADGDMLLCEWGTYDWGRGERFTFDITRQLIPTGGDDEHILQLRLTIGFEPEPQLAALGAANRWCESVERLEGFVARVVGAAAFDAVADRGDGEVALAVVAAG